MRGDLSDVWTRKESRMKNQTKSRPRFDPIHQEWSLRTGTNTWLVWKHGDDPRDEQRLLDALDAELAQEQAEDR